MTNFDEISRCHARIKFDRENEVAVLLREHNHSPETEIDPDSKPLKSSS